MVEELEVEVPAPVFVGAGTLVVASGTNEELAFNDLTMLYCTHKPTATTAISAITIMMTFLFIAPRSTNSAETNIVDNCQT